MLQYTYTSGNPIELQRHYLIGGYLGYTTVYALISASIINRVRRIIKMVKSDEYFIWFCVQVII